MTKTVVKIDGMMCGMCEAHVNNAVRNAFAVKRVAASRTKGEAEIVSEAPLDIERLRAVIAETGYTVGEIREETYRKKGLLGFFRK